jgi:hypothetical protein
MNYRLTKEELRESAYYCGAGVDLQPLLRFGDVIDNFIYVSVGISKNEFINGLNDFLDNIKSELHAYNSSLEIINSTEFNIEEIEHKKLNRLVHGIPDYFTDNEFKNYIENFKQFYGKTSDYNLEVTFKLKIANFEKTIRLFHLTGEALATYDVIFRKQEIAPKIFISIQTGAIEIPDLFSNRMFELSTEKPKIWLRGIWSEEEYPMFKNYNVFNTSGLYNESIGEYRNWKVRVANNINSTTNESKQFRIVHAFGQKKEWEDVETSVIESNGLTINKILGAYNGTMQSNYDFTKIHFPISNLFQITELVSEYYLQNQDKELIKVAILPTGYESFEIILNEFVENYIGNQNFKLVIDIYYVNKSDIKRDF